MNSCEAEQGSLNWGLSKVVREGRGYWGNRHLVTEGRAAAVRVMWWVGSQWPLSTASLSLWRLVFLLWHPGLSLYTCSVPPPLNPATSSTAHHFTTSNQTPHHPLVLSCWAFYYATPPPMAVFLWQSLTQTWEEPWSFLFHYHSQQAEIQFLLVHAHFLWTHLNLKIAGVMYYFLMMGVWVLAQFP